MNSIHVLWNIYTLFQHIDPTDYNHLDLFILIID